MQFNFRNLKKGAVTIAFGLSLLILGNVITANAQNHGDRYNNRRDSQHHRRDDRRDQRRHQINRSQVYYGNNGYYNNGYYNNGYYNNNYNRNNYNRRSRSNSGGLLRIIFGNGRNHRRH